MTESHGYDGSEITAPVGIYEYYFDLLMTARPMTIDAGFIRDRMVVDAVLIEIVDDFEEIIPGGGHWVSATMRLVCKMIQNNLKKTDLAAYTTTPGYGAF